jgi:hypothetical protein
MFQRTQEIGKAQAGILALPAELDTERRKLFHIMSLIRGEFGANAKPNSSVVTWIFV